MTRTLAYRSIPTHCTTCGRNLAHDETHISGWTNRRITYYCASCDPRHPTKDHT